MITRLLAIPLLAWGLGFALFAVLLPGPADDRHTDAIVVLTGGAGALARGHDPPRAGKAERMVGR